MGETIQTTCCIAGGGPAGMMLGYLLARAGIVVTVLEKHTDFLRDFRGDTIHPSTLELMYELGLLEEFLKQPHDRTTQLKGFVNGHEIVMADFTHVPTHCKFLAFMPQWDFLNFLAQQAKVYPHFRLIMGGEVKNIIEEDGAIKGVKAVTADGAIDIRAALTIGADGRGSILRKKAGLVGVSFGAPMDVLWMRIPQEQGDPDQSGGRIQDGKILAMLDRGDYWQCAYVIPKGGIEDVKQKGIENFRSAIAKIAPFLANRTQHIGSWDDVKLLTVEVDRLQQWFRPGLLCIGDAAHAMSPIGGVGINLAIQDAVATANIVAEPLRRGAVTVNDLVKVQDRREWPTVMTQRLQLFLQKNVIARVLRGKGSSELPWQLKILRAFPFLQRLPARLIGVGFRPEHIKIF